MNKKVLRPRWEIMADIEVHRIQKEAKFAWFEAHLKKVGWKAWCNEHTLTKVDANSFAHDPRK